MVRVSEMFGGLLAFLYFSPLYFVGTLNKTNIPLALVGY